MKLRLEGRHRVYVACKDQELVGVFSTIDKARAAVDKRYGKGAWRTYRNGTWRRPVGDSSVAVVKLVEVDA